MRHTQWCWCVVGICGVLSFGVVAGAEPAKRPEPFRYDPAGHRDPFVSLVRDGRVIGAPVASARQGSLKPVLQGIVWDPSGVSFALINDEELNVGDTVDGYRVMEIRRDAVVLSNDVGESLVLTISFEEVKPREDKRPDG